MLEGDKNVTCAANMTFANLKDGRTDWRCTQMYAASHDAQWAWPVAPTKMCVRE